jgi:CubicO group peptidase (beta-lactamase class C family)
MARAPGTLLIDGLLRSGFALARFSLGFMKPSEWFRFGGRIRRSGGAGRSMGYADPEVGIGYGYVTNRMGMSPQGDPRNVALRAVIPPLTRR